MLEKFLAYQMSVGFYRESAGAAMPGFLRTQMLRASSSVCLNLAEGSTCPMGPNRVRFYRIALGSVRECQAILDLNPRLLRLRKSADELGACVYRLCHPKPR